MKPLSCWNCNTITDTIPAVTSDVWTQEADREIGVNICWDCSIDNKYFRKLEDRSLKGGYHLDAIPKGELGELSKIYEELYEAIDSEKQGCAIMVLVELSDLVGALSAYLNKHHPSITMDDLIKMSNVTKRAFESGERK